MSDGPAYIGIDFGTTNSATARSNPETNQDEILYADGEDKVPSLVHYGEDGEVLIGKDVEDLLENSDHHEEAERAEITQKVVKSIKRNLINSPVIPILGRESVRPVEVVAEILKKLKRDAQEVLDETRFTYLPQRRKEVCDEKDRLESFLPSSGRPAGTPESPPSWRNSPSNA